MRVTRMRRRDGDLEGSDEGVEHASRRKAGRHATSQGARSPAREQLLVIFDRQLRGIGKDLPPAGYFIEARVSERNDQHRNARDQPEQGHRAQQNIDGQMRRAQPPEQASSPRRRRG